MGMICNYNYISMYWFIDIYIYVGCFKLFHLPFRSAWLLLDTQNIFSAGKKTPTETWKPKPMIPSIKSIKPPFFTSLVAQLARNCHVLLLLLRLPLRGQDWAFLRHRRGHVLYGLAISTEIPSGYVKVAIENDHRNSGFSQLENGDFP